MYDWPEAVPLETPRLLLEPLVVTHAQEMTRVLADVELYRYTGGNPPTLQELTKRYARQAVGHSADGGQGWLNWIIRSRDSSNAIGFVQTTIVHSRDLLAAEIAWVIAPKHQGHGFATEAAASMMDWVSERGGKMFIAYIHPKNSASIGVARKLDMHATGNVVGGEVRWETSVSG